ncbi:MAG: hypothetical protein WBL80_03570 [Erysipelotrichaceae bacterium]
MRCLRTSTKGFILYQSLLYFLFCIHFVTSVSVIAIHIRSENAMLRQMEEFSFFEAAILDRIYHDLQRMDYGDFNLTYDDLSVTVTYQDQSATLAFSGDVESRMKLTFDDLVPCFIDYEEASD